MAPTAAQRKVSDGSFEVWLSIIVATVPSVRSDGVEDVIFVKSIPSLPCVPVDDVPCMFIVPPGYRSENEMIALEKREIRLRGRNNKIGRTRRPKMSVSLRKEGIKWMPRGQKAPRAIASPAGWRSDA